MKTRKWVILISATLILQGCLKRETEKKTVLAIPVYGQSLALGEEAIRITDFQQFSAQCHHRVLTENLDEQFGFLSDTHFKQWMKKLLQDRHRAFELSIYGMSEAVIKYLDQKGYGDRVMLCTFPGWQGASSIVDIGEGTKPYQKFLEEITAAQQKAHDKGWDFVVPAFCWMQGEDDALWKKSVDYKKDLKTFQRNLNKDIKAITHQKRDVICICYQTNCLTLTKAYKPNSFTEKESQVPQAQLELVRDDEHFMASGPTYPYTFAENSAHIDGLSQKRLGYLAGLSVIRLLDSMPSKGLTPAAFELLGDTLNIRFNIPKPPLVFDTVAVTKASNYGFSVIDASNTNIIRQVHMEKDRVIIYCYKSPLGCKVRYAVNGSPRKNGFREGPRGNLRDSQGNFLKATIQKKVYPLHNWCYQFDVLLQETHRTNSK